MEVCLVLDIDICLVNNTKFWFTNSVVFFLFINEWNERNKYKKTAIRSKKG